MSPIHILRLKTSLFILIFSLCIFSDVFGQENDEGVVQTLAIKSRGLQRVGNTFESIWLIDNQTVHVPLRKTLEFDILHRFGTIKNGYSDFLGLYAPSNIRLGFGYTPINRLMVGFGFTKDRLLWDINWKYAILRENKDKSIPVSITYFGNIGIDTRKKENFVKLEQQISQAVIGLQFQDPLTQQLNSIGKAVTAIQKELNSVQSWIGADASSHLPERWKGWFESLPAVTSGHPLTGSTTEFQCGSVELF